MSLSNQSSKSIDIYLKALKKEFGFYKQILDNAEIGTLYFGGGTPTYLNIRQLNDIIRFFTNNLNLKPDAEITVEASPETMIGKGGVQKLHYMIENGVNRLSFGVQSFSDDILELLGRRHDSYIAEKAFKNARECGFDNISLDLMYALPTQTMKHWEHSLNRVGKLKPESVTSYPLRINPFTQINELFMKEPEIFPDEKIILLMNIMLIEKMKEFGYNQNPVNWFNREDSYLYRHNMSKWTFNGELIGFGPSTYSYLNGCQYINTFRIGEYYKSLSNGKLPILRGQKLSKKEQMHRAMVFGLKKREGVDKREFKMGFGISLDEVFKDTIGDLERLGMISNTPRSISLTYSGILFAGRVCKRFYSEDVKTALKNITSLNIQGYGE